MTKVKFENLGRGKACFEVEIAKFDHRCLLKAVRPHLASSDVQFSVEPDTNRGTVLVGGYRPVGTFKVVADELQEKEA